ncbi:MAG TPA: VWA domain-containing protein [Thermoanaerobaculaceae bacterium]|nr:VWA domain-containing protein [Thermoanaerobaculaceae bacterium]HRS15727.1 VWA domain-containing protein [Thermoanaerobaculaceae bacterium]
MRLRVPTLVVSGVCLLGARGLAAEPPDPARTYEASASVSSVLVPVTVRDGKGRLVSNLDQKKFRLFVDGIEFPIKSFWREGGLPISYTFLLDTSGSMGRRRLGKAAEAILEMVGQLRPHDEVCLITFGAAEVKRRLPFGSDPGQLRPLLDSLRGFGTTALYDLLTIAPQAMDGAKNVRRAIILFTDGVDTASDMKPEDALKVLEGLSDPLYVLGIEPPPAEEGPEDGYEQLLMRFAAASGGRYLRVDQAAKLPDFAKELRRELSMRYIIDFQPSGLGSVKWRKIEVRVDGGYEVTARLGYSGTLP